MKFVLAAGLLVFLLGLIVVLLSAFRKRFSWGIGLIVLPVFYPLYAILNWSETRARNGLLISIIGFLVTSAALYGGASEDILDFSQNVSSEPVQTTVAQLVTKVPTAHPPKEQLPNEAQAREVILPEGDSYDPLFKYDEYTQVAIEPLPPKEDKRVTAPVVPVPSYEYRMISLQEVSNHYGKKIKIKTKKGQEKAGNLIESDEFSLSIAMPHEDGFVAFQYNFDDITAVSVYDIKE